MVALISWERRGCQLSTLWDLTSNRAPTWRCSVWSDAQILAHPERKVSEDVIAALNSASMARNRDWDFNEGVGEPYRNSLLIRLGDPVR
ncbi:hypothetical protein BH10CYA1_BH10CYA1_02150 [soil metagenome]